MRAAPIYTLLYKITVKVTIPHLCLYQLITMCTENFNMSAILIVIDVEPKGSQTCN